MLHFCLQSLIREYGWQFIRHVALPHPIRTVRAALGSGRIDLSADPVSAGDEEDNTPELERGRSIVGLGFCLKPMEPCCPSGRANHDCLYLERLSIKGSCSANETPAACWHCAIREIGAKALEAGAALYIMTTARDMLFDVFTPSLREGRFTKGMFALCRYSFRPFAVGLLASGMRGWMYPFERGDCADYRTWLLADRGIKNGQTILSGQARTRLLKSLASGRKAGDAAPFLRRGNLFFPES